MAASPIPRRSNSMTQDRSISTETKDRDSEEWETWISISTTSSPCSWAEEEAWGEWAEWEEWVEWGAWEACLEDLSSQAEEEEVKDTNSEWGDIYANL